MLKREKSCGGIIFNKDNSGEFRYLLVRHKKSKNSWGFPKGHVENDEVEEETALREIHEEVGLDVTLFAGFEERVTFKPRRDILKTVVYFACESKSTDVKYIFDEIAEHKWLLFPDALKQLRHKNNKQILTRADQFVREQFE